VRVLDLSWVWAGPHATTRLAFLGAEVVKVESSKRLDLTRRSTPYPTGMAPGINRTGYFNIINQAKLSIGIDLSRPEGIALVRQLAAKSDVLISNFGTGVAERLGVGAEAMLKLNPALTIAMISAFGQTGPYRNYTGYGPLISPLAGLSVQTAYREDGEPRDVGMPYGDPNGGIHAAVAIAAALCARQAKGTGGQVIDLSMWECMLGLTYEGWMNHALGNPSYPPMGNRDPFHAPHNVYACRGDDQWVALAVTEERQWPALCRAIGQPGLAVDPRFADRAARKVHEDALDALLAAWCRTRDRWAITEALQAQGVAAYPCLTTKDLAESPQLEARGLFTRWPHPEVGVQTLLGAPWRLARRPNGVGGAAPLLGQHTDVVLERILGLDAAKRAELRAQGIVE
jgi:crotonobetainyl-CoA:carnitine CoA-transferase CaiB-like acyl-CoA transferase